MKTNDVQAIKDLSVISLPTYTPKSPATGGLKFPAQPIENLTLNPVTTETPNAPCINCSGHSSAQVQTIEPLATNKSDTWLPINVYLPGSSAQTPPDNTTNPLTESERRKRAIYIASGILLVFIIILWVSSRKK
jgi:hypothetical protein